MTRKGKYDSLATSTMCVLCSVKTQFHCMCFLCYAAKAKQHLIHICAWTSEWLRPFFQRSPSSSSWFWSSADCWCGSWSSGALLARDPVSRTPFCRSSFSFYEIWLQANAISNSVLLSVMQALNRCVSRVKSWRSPLWVFGTACHFSIMV